MPAATAIHVLNTADWTMPEGMMMQLGGDEPIAAKCPAYLIEHPDALVLFDTGLSHDLVEDPTGYGAPMLEDFTPAIDPEATPADHLADLGYEPTDVDHVVMSHLHTDHAGNLDQFADAEIHVHIDELRYAWWPDPPQVPFYTDADLEPLRDPGVEVTEVTGRTDLLGDGSVELLPTPGHTPGHQSLKVDRGDETVVLASDLANRRAGYEGGLVAPFGWSTDEALDSLRDVKATARAADAEVIVHHDADDLARLAEL